jgi:predicted amidohydrolase
MLEEGDGGGGGGGVRVVDVVGANSAVLYGPDGMRVGHYRKSHLFHMDKVWAKPGEFVAIE